jgi:hypothetical protein
MATKRGQSFQDTTTIESATNATIKAAVATCNYTITEIIVSIYAFQNDGTLALNDGTTTYFGPFLCKDGNGHTIFLRFKDGFTWGKGKAIIVTVGTSAVKARVTVKGFMNS